MQRTALPTDWTASLKLAAPAAAPQVGQPAAPRVGRAAAAEQPAALPADLLAGLAAGQPAGLATGQATAHQGVTCVRVVTCKVAAYSMVACTGNCQH